MQEIFRTIQGEGPFAGLPAIFIRLAGCNLRCHFCDTEFEANWHHQLAAEDVVEQVCTLSVPSTKLVVITGGEPLLQNLVPLVEQLFRCGFHVQIETAGTVFDESLWKHTTDDTKRPVPGKLSVVVSPKTPSINHRVADVAAAWKYIIKRGECTCYDGLPLANTQNPDGEKKQLARPAPAVLQDEPWRIYLQPCDEQDAEKTTANTTYAAELAQAYGYRLCLQVHKLVGLP